MGTHNGQRNFIEAHCPVLSSDSESCELKEKAPEATGFTSVRFWSFSSVPQLDLGKLHVRLRDCSDQNHSHFVWDMVRWSI